MGSPEERPAGSDAPLAHHGEPWRSIATQAQAARGGIAHRLALGLVPRSELRTDLAGRRMSASSRLATVLGEPKKGESRGGRDGDRATLSEAQLNTGAWRWIKAQRCDRNPRGRLVAGRMCR
jgi:hypothetical protein